VDLELRTGSSAAYRPTTDNGAWGAHVSLERRERSGPRPPTGARFQRRRRTPVFAGCPQPAPKGPLHAPQNAGSQG
jgi:hypothetical protein